MSKIPQIINDYPNKLLLQHLWKFIQPYKAKFFLGTFLRVTSDLVWLYPVWALGEIITFVAGYTSGDDVIYVWQLLGGIGVVSLYHFVMHDLSKYYIYQVAENVRIDTAKSSVRHIFDIDMSWHEKENTGNKMQKIIKGSESLNQIIRMWVDMVIESFINLFAILIILAFFDVWLTVILLFFFVTYYIISYYLTLSARRAVHAVNVEREGFVGMSFESVNNIALVKSLRIGEKIFPYLQKMSEALSAKVRLKIIRFRTRSVVLNLYQEFFRILLIVFTLLQIFSGNLEVGVLAMVLLYFGKIEEASYEFAHTYNQFMIGKLAIFRMQEILDTKPEIELLGNEKFDKNWKTLSLENLTFSYRGQKVLDNFSLDIQRGEKIGIVGVSGTGKSTLFKLLLKLYTDYSGKISFDGKNLADIKRASYMKNVAVVPQETELFNLSLAENIKIVGENFSGKNPVGNVGLRSLQEEDTLFQKSLDIAHVGDFVHKLPDGVESLVGEKGVKLSGGEKQRVGIARAIYKKPDILFLDEATSHLDMESERKIQDALHIFLQDITAVVIAHRLSTIREMDRIVVMDLGKVLEVGSFDDLMKNRGAFYKLWEKQKF